MYHGRDEATLVNNSSYGNVVLINEAGRNGKLFLQLSYQDMIKQTRVFAERIHLLKSVITISYVVFSLHYTRSSL